MNYPRNLKYYLSRTVLTPSGCMEWQGAINNKGYGKAGHNKGHWLVHRLVYTLIHGEIDALYVIRHTCDNRLCINPEHLVAGTPQDNVHDQIERGKLKPPQGACRDIKHYR